jgi:hypothetical protein
VEEELKHYWNNFSKHASIFWSWLNLIIYRKSLKISKDPTLLFNPSLKNIPANIVWQARGVYKIVIEPTHSIISGKTSHIILPITEKETTWSFIFYGLNKTETKFLPLSGSKFVLNTENFPKKIPLSTAFFDFTEEKILAFSRIKTKPIRVICRTPFLNISVPKVEIPWVNLKLSLPQLKFPKYK